MDEKVSVGFSIVLCTYNGESRLGPTLSHIAGLTVPVGIAVELIVVNNASTDQTETFAQEAWVKLGQPFQLTILTENRPGKGYAVEKGYDAVSYSYIVTVDDDNWLDTNYLITAADLFQRFPDVSLLQGYSTAVFEVPFPEWAHEFKNYFVVGGPVDQPGYFPANEYHVWGAGMVIKKIDWNYLRNIGFTFLTSKVPGKAAGEDHETAIALLLLGRKIYYSDCLRYKHFMPADRITWSKLQQSFEVYGYVRYYLTLYALVLDAYENNCPPSSIEIKKRFFKLLPRICYKYTWKQHIAYWLSPKKEYYQLRLLREYSYYKSFILMSNNIMKDVKSLQKWMGPLLAQNRSNFRFSQEI